MTTKSFSNIQVAIDTRGIGHVTIHRPAVLNALNSETLLELRVALESLTVDRALRVLVLTGSGEKSFIAGADISEMKDKSLSEGVTFAKLGQDVTKLLEFMPVPTIAAVNGFALGGGTEMAISCDFILAADNAVFGQPEVSLGIIPGFGATARLARFVGWPMARELIFTGRKVKAQEAKELGLVNHVYPAGEFRAKVQDMADMIAGHSNSAIRVSKVLMNQFVESVGISGKLDAEAQEFGGLFGSHDQREGMTAFIEKRKAQFQGRKSGHVEGRQ